MREDNQFDLVVVGGGTGGLGVARPCIKAGWKVAIVDCYPFGGTCMLRGCDPKKMLVAVTEALDSANRLSDQGLQGRKQSINWAGMMAFKRSWTDVMPGRLEKGLEKLGAELIHGVARFLSPEILQVGDRELHARHFHIATGARPVTLDIPGEELVTTSTDFLELQALPARVAFIGGGFIAFEFAHIASRAGASEVVVLQSGKRPLVHFDPEIVAVQMERTRELGIDVRCESRVEAVRSIGDGLQVEFATPQGRETIVCDLVVHGAGRVPNVDGLNLEAAQVEVGRRGIRVNEFMRSVSNPSVFSVGDCADTGAPNLTPISANEARIAAKNLLAGEDVRPMKYPPIPSVVFTLPPVARVGLLEEEARQQGLEFDVRFQKTKNWYSSLRVREQYSACKVLVERSTGKILGAHLTGPGAEEQINLFAMAMGVGMTANQLKGVIFAYPSYASDLGSML
ncbi:MAG: glutathione reductase (NADPH) [Rhodothermales bacterium]|jgi:glutathione reductase (NADPH)